jgi:WD40 repeat protein
VVVLAAVVSSWQAVRATRAEWEQSRLLGVAQTALRREAEQRQRAEAQQRAALRRAYCSDMNLVQQALAANNNGRAVGLMDRYRPGPGEPDFRQWEWRYFWSQSRSAAAFSLPRQSDAVEELAISPNGRLLASRERRGRLKLWDLATRTEVATMASEGFRARAFAFSGDGERLAAVVRDDRRGPKGAWDESRTRTVKIWAVAAREVAAEFAYEGSIASITFGPGDERLLVLGQDMAVAAWDFDDGRLDMLLPADESQERRRRLGTLSPDGRLVAVAEEGRIRIIDVASGTETTTLDVLEGDIASLAFSPDGALLATGFLFTETATHIKLFSTASGEEVRRLVGHVSWVPSLVFTADGRRLVSAGADQTVRVWDVSDGRELTALQGHLSEVYCVAATADGQTIVSGCKDGTILGWDADDVEPKQRFETLPVAVRDLQFLPDGGQMLSVNADGTVTLWDARTLQATETISALGDDVTDLLIDPNGARLFAAVRGGTLKVLDWATRLVITDLKPGGDRRAHVEPVGLTDAGRTLVVAGRGPSVLLVDTVTWEMRPLRREGRMPRHARAQILSPDGRYLLAADFGGSIQFQPLEGGATEVVATGQDWGVTDVAFSPDSRLLAVSSTEGTVSLWDTETREIADVLSGHLLGVHAVAFSPDGQRLASASQGNEAVKLWDVTTRHEVASLTGEGLIGAPLRFSPDGRLLIAVSSKGKAHLWRAPSLAEIAGTRSPGSLVQEAALTRDGMKKSAG